MKVILSHPTGNANVRAAADGLLQAGLLAEFQTSIASFPGGLLHGLGGIGPLAEIRRRGFDPKLIPFTRQWPWRESGRLLASRLHLSGLTRHESGIFCVDEVYRSIDKRTGHRMKALNRKGLEGVYAYEDGAYHTFSQAKKLGIRCLYDLPIGYWRSLRAVLNTEKERWPTWISTMTGIKNSEAKLSRKDDELKLADAIFVASSFTATTLRDFPGQLAPVSVIPYGFPSVYEQREYDGRRGGPLKLLFVGGLSQRKGIAYLFAAVESFGRDVELTIVGRKASEDCKPLNDALSRHKWIPSVSNAAVLELMRQHDVLVFPSLFEGFGLVITEAMSQGTPVITTERTAGPDLITNGEDGWVIEGGSTSALKAAIERLVNNRDLVISAGIKATETARKSPWSVYSKALAEAVAAIL